MNRIDSKLEVQESMKNTTIANFTRDFIEIIQTKLQTIILSLTNNSDVDKVELELVKLEGNIRKLLEKNTRLNKFTTENIETKL